MDRAAVLQAKLGVKIYPGPDFDDPSKWSEITEEMPAAADFAAKLEKHLKEYDSEDLLTKLFSHPTLNAKQETHLFRKFNFYQYRCKVAIDNGDIVAATRLFAKAESERNFIVQSNIRLVAFTLKSMKLAGDDEYISFLMSGLPYITNCFDWRRGFKFSTYAVWAMKKNLTTYIKTKKKHESYFTEMPDETCFAANDPEILEGLDDPAVVKVVIDELLEGLQEREAAVLRERYAFNDFSGTTKKIQLRILGKKYGVTKERIRQIEARAIRKLREIAREKGLKFVA
jgi:RNA polymerase sigma factor (sigma-70 family)